MKTSIGILSLVLAVASGAAWADSGPLRDPTGCATGSAVANCRSVPSLGREPSGSSLRGGSSLRDSHQPRRMKTSPLPSEFLPPSSTGLSKGSTGIGNGSMGGSGGSKSRFGH